MSERAFKVGDRVQVKDNAIPFGWLRPGQISTITGLYEGSDIYLFKNPLGGSEARYYGRELELVERAPKKPTRADVNRLLKKARKVTSVYDDEDSTLDEYLRALRKFEQAVTEVMNK